MWCLNATSQLNFHISEMIGLVQQSLSIESIYLILEPTPHIESTIILIIIQANGVFHMTWDRKIKLLV